MSKSVHDSDPLGPTVSLPQVKRPRNDDETVQDVQSDWGEVCEVKVRDTVGGSGGQITHSG